MIHTRKTYGFVEIIDEDGKILSTLFDGDNENIKVIINELQNVIENLEDYFK